VQNSIYLVDLPGHW